MIITKTTKYNRSYKKNIVNKHLIKESERIENIINFLLSKNNFHEVMNDSLRNIYGISKKNGDLKEYYTARVNDKMRLLMKPNSNYPYDLIEIEEIIFCDIDNTHYGEG